MMRKDIKFFRLLLESFDATNRDILTHDFSGTKDDQLLAKYKAYFN